MKADSKEMDDAKQRKAGAQSTKATANGELAATKESLATSSKTLSTMDVGCKTASSDHEASVAARAEELKALANIEVVNLLRELARRDQSSALAQLASRVSSA